MWRITQQSQRSRQIWATRFAVEAAAWGRQREHRHGRCRLGPGRHAHNWVAALRQERRAAVCRFHGWCVAVYDIACVRFGLYYSCSRLLL
jgi:hypothetical protein